MRVLLDARIDSPTGIGRYCRCLAAALQQHAPPSVQVTVLRRTGTPRYTVAEMREVLGAARACRADIIHLTDYRIRLEDPGIPLITTVHDTMRITNPDNCDTDHRFTTRFSPEVFDELLAATQRLRAIVALPPGTTRAPRSIHEEFYARMLAYSCRRSAQIITSTRTVANQLATAVGGNPPIRTVRWGLDHLKAPPLQPTDPASRDGYFLYVGQTGRHKNLATLFDAYLASQAITRDIPLNCVGRDFRPSGPAHNVLIQRLGGHGRPLGTRDDDELADLYTHATAVIHLAEDEGLGLPPLEALATGTRVIASDIPVFRETLNGHATLVDHTNAKAVAEAMDQHLTTADSPQARSARIKWTRQYTWARHVQDILAVYGGVAPL